MSEYICPNCKKPIYDDEALLCLYCGESLQRGVGVMGKMKYPSPKILVAIAVVVVIVSFCLMMI